MRLTMPSVFWSHTATVYTPNAAGKYVTVNRANLRCRLILAGYEPSGLEPVIDQPTARLAWADASYSLPHDCEVLVNGTRWNPRHGSEKAPAPLGLAVYGAVDVIRAEAQR